MRIQKGMTICGVDIVPLRKFVRGRAFVGTFSVEDFGRELQLDHAKATSLIASLRKEGYLERVRDKTHPWGVTLKLSAIAGAKFTKAIKRDRLEALLDAVISRAESFNSDPSRCADILAISVFGSYWRDQSDYGDLDLTLRSRAKDDWYKQNWKTLWNAPHRDITIARHLKGRQPHISITLNDVPPGADLRRVWTAARGRLKRPVREKT